MSFSCRGGVYPRPLTFANTATDGDKPRPYSEYQAINEYTHRGIIDNFFYRYFWDTTFGPVLIYMLISLEL
jgi:hypothetical protein